MCTPFPMFLFCRSPSCAQVRHIDTIKKVNTRRCLQTKFLLSLSIPDTGYYTASVSKIARELLSGQRFLGESGFLTLRSKAERFSSRRKNACVSASWFSCSQIATGVFTLGTAAILPFYALMVLAPKSNLATVVGFFSLFTPLFILHNSYTTKRSIDSSIPYVLLGALYAFLLYLSWTPDTLRLIFASKYWLPELSGIAHMFKNEMTLASAWIHLLVVDLFAARQVFHDGQKHEIDSRHSISLCLLSCPIGIMSHAFTKAITRRSSNGK